VPIEALDPSSRAGCRVERLEGVADVHHSAGVPRRNRISVAAEGHERLIGDGALHVEHRADRLRRRAQRLGTGQRTHRGQRIVTGSAGADTNGVLPRKLLPSESHAYR
jgi:hypothetical protein